MRRGASRARRPSRPASHLSRTAPSLQRGAAGGMDHDAVLALLGLHGFAALRVEESDTRCVVGWRDGLVVCAFRGTQTMQNVLSDIKAW